MYLGIFSAGLEKWSEENKQQVQDAIFMDTSFYLALWKNNQSLSCSFHFGWNTWEHKAALVQKYFYKKYHIDEKEYERLITPNVKDFVKDFIKSAWRFLAAVV